MSYKCSYYYWQSFVLSGPAYCFYKNRRVDLGYCNANCLQGGANCSYCQEARNVNFFVLIMNCCINDGIEVDKCSVYNSLEKLKDYLLRRRNQEGINVLVSGERIGLEVAKMIKYSLKSEAGTLLFLEAIYDSYIKAIVDYVSCGDYDNAFDCYKRMIDDLVVNFGLNRDFVKIKGEVRKPLLAKVKLNPVRQKLGGSRKFR